MLREFRDQADSMFYHVRVKTTGWVGFGFAETAPNNIMNYDVIVGGFSNGKGYLHVSFSFIVFVSLGKKGSILEIVQSNHYLEGEYIGLSFSIANVSAFESDT